MYLGLILSYFGGVLIYRAWTYLLLAIGFLWLVLRARREEQALRSAFGQAWLEYCQRTPAWLPRFIQNRSDSQVHPSDPEREK